MLRRRVPEILLRVPRARDLETKCCNHSPAGCNRAGRHHSTFGQAPSPPCPIKRVVPRSLVGLLAIAFLHSTHWQTAGRELLGMPLFVLASSVARHAVENVNYTSESCP